MKRRPTAPTASKGFNFFLRRALGLSLPVLAWLSVSACSTPRPQASPTLNVAAAANLAEVFRQLAAEFERSAGVRVTLSFASTAQLAKQIEHGAPFDVFAAADREHPEELMRRGLAQRPQIYAVGRVALWSPKLPLRSLADIASPQFKVIALPNPALAPYGAAARQALQSLGLWTQIQPRIVYAENVNMARQYAGTGNADAAFTASSLLRGVSGSVLLVDATLHSPIEQAIALIHDTPAARSFIGFVLSERGQQILESYGYQRAAASTRSNTSSSR